MDPSLPTHIVAADIPTGAYWDRASRHWYTIYNDGDGARRVRLGDARLSLANVHTRLQDVRGVDRSSLDWLMGEFEKSSEFARLARLTQHDYRRYRATASRYPTKTGALGSLPAARLSTPLFQGIVDALEAAGTPTKANHLLRYLRRVYSWALRRTSLTTNPCKGVTQAHERKRRRLPETAVFARVLAYAQERGARTPHSTGSVAGYLWTLMELQYLCRLRSIEAITLTDANALEAGVLTNRRKGSRDNIVAWSPRLRAAWTAAEDRRRRILGAQKRPVPLDPSARVLLVNETGGKLTAGAVQTAWSKLMRAAIRDGLIAPEERFGTHDCKRRGVTDSVGNRHDKQQASGHRSERMMDVYDLEIPIVQTPEPR